MGSSCQVVGTDRGTRLEAGECWGSYAIYVSNDKLEHFNCQGHILENEIEMKGTYHLQKLIVKCEYIEYLERFSRAVK